MTDLERELAELDALPMYLSVREAAAVLSVHERTIHRMADRKEITMNHAGTAARVPRSSLRAWVIRQHEQREAEENGEHAVEA